MGFNYQKHKDSEHGNQWTSYSDLFMGLSFIFLLLYVTASVRTGATGIQSSVQMQKVAMENEDLKNQLKVYESLKKDYLQNEASEDEAKMYEELMGKLDLLQGEAKTEKDKLQAEARENAKKERALNKYQQAIRNILNANMISKSRLKTRNDVIDNLDQEVAVKSTQISDLEQTVQQKRQEIAAREQQLSNMNAELDKKMKQLKVSFKNQTLTKKKYEAQIAQAQKEYANRMSVLHEQNQKAQKQLQAVNEELGAAKSNLAQKDAVIGQKDAEKKYLETKLGAEQQGHAQEIAKLRGEFAAQAARDRAAFDAEMKRQKLGAAERAAQEAAFRAKAAQKERELGDRIAGLGKKLGATEGELAKAKAEMEARKNVAREIQEGFRKAGIKAEVDGETGDVTLDFGDHYFDSGRADLKPEMAKILQKAMPIYSKSLMENKKIADKISSIEIIGYASPTYKGRVIDPNSLKPEDKMAVEYNLDLSYQRAKSIFNFAFDPNKLSYAHQKDIRPLVKVSGKSFFEAAKLSREVANATSAADFCKKNDCKKSQRVLIKFTVDQKK
jgi:outer membrane protein OmpA-like peptidoglycan-associated protein